MRRLIVSLFVATLANHAIAGQRSLAGDEPGTWDRAGYCVVVAVIQDVEAVKSPGHDLFKAKLRPLASLAGRCDPSANPVLAVEFYAGGYGTSIAAPPKSGAMIVAVLERRDAENQGRGYYLSSDHAEFMPGSSAIVEVKDMADPRIAEILRKLQEARAHPLPDPNAPSQAAPATRPTQKTGQLQSCSADPLLTLALFGHSKLDFCTFWDVRHV